MRTKLAVGALIFSLLLILPGSYAQSVFGTLTGTVTDNTGAVVPGADITVKNMASGDVRKTVSNKEGYFSVTTLPAGTYAVTAETKGFTKWERSGIVLNSSDTRTIKIDLSVAGTKELVEVTGAVSEVAVVDSGEKSALISYKELQDLSLVSRNAAEFIKLLPGATLPVVGGVGNANAAINKANYTGETIGINGGGMSGNQGGVSAANINGQQVDIAQDGGHTFDPGAFGSATPVNPNSDMIAEVKVLTSNFGAENAKGPVIVNFISKSGGNTFHGEGYLYARNSAMNATDAFNKQTGSPKGESSYWYPGFNIGGPILIPGTGFNKSRQKLFFFQGFEYYKQTIDGGVMRAFAPTEDMYNGDFSKADTYGIQQAMLGVIPTIQPAPVEGWRWQAFRPGCTITGGVLSPECIDPNARLLLKAYMPAANTDPLTNNGYNWKQNFSVPQNSYQSLTRGDWNISDNTKVFVRYNRQRETQNQPSGLWGGRGSDNMVPSPTNIIGANGSDSLSSSLTHVFSPTMTNEATFTYTKINFPNSPVDPKKLLREDMGFPYKGIYGNAMAPALVTWGGSFPNLGEIGHDYHPTMICYKGISSLTDNFTKVMGTHTAKLGFYWERVYNTQDNWGQYMGAFNYGPYGGVGYTGADGHSYNGVTGNSFADILMGVGFGGYTETALPPPGTISQNIYSFYLQDSWKLTRRLTLEYGMRFEHIGKPYDGVGYGIAIFDESKYNNDPSALDQNTGVLWHKLDPSVPLSGAKSRLFYFSPRVGMAWDVFGNANTVVRGGWGKYRAYDSVQSNYYTGPAGTAIGSVSWGCNFNDARCPVWAAVDNNATTAQFGQPLGPGLKSIAVMDPKNDELPLVTSYSLSVNQRLPWKFTAELSYVGNQGDFLNTSQPVDINAAPLFSMGLPGAGNVDDFRPRRNFQGINMSENSGKSQFDSFQASLKRTVGLLTLQGNYTWSKSMGNGNNQTGVFDDFGLHYFWGVLPQNRAQAFSLAYVLTLPKIKGGNAFVRGVANGWQISGITQVQSGANLIAMSQYFGNNLSNVNILGTSGLNVYPVLVCDPTKNLAPHQYLNGNCFQKPEVGQLTHGGWPYFPGPKYFNSDLSLMKNFPVNERHNIQFRFQMFNFLNHPLESFTGNDANLKLNYGDGSNVPTNAPTFGFANYKYGNRIVELAIKYQF